MIKKKLHRKKVINYKQMDILKLTLQNQNK